MMMFFLKATIIEVEVSKEILALVEQSKNEDLFNWLTILTAILMLVITGFQLRLLRKQFKIQETLAKMDQVPSIMLDLLYYPGILQFKNVGKTQIFLFESISLNVLGREPNEVNEINSSIAAIGPSSYFGYPFDLGLPRNVENLNRRVAVKINGKAILKNYESIKYDFDFTIELKLTMSSSNKEDDIVHSCYAWVTKFEERGRT